jgi:hypothetical protein
VADLLALFRFLVPFFGTSVDEEIEQALTAAAGNRPACLTIAQQDEAQVYYAAHLLYQRWLQTQAAQSPIPFGVKSEKEGDLARTYGSTDLGTDPYNFWRNYSDLARLCGGVGAITVGHRYGSCCGPFH